MTIFVDEMLHGNVQIRVSIVRQCFHDLLANLKLRAAINKLSLVCQAGHRTDFPFYPLAWVRTGNCLRAG